MDVQSLCLHTKDKGPHKPGEKALLWSKRCAVFFVDQKGRLEQEEGGVRSSQNLTHRAAWSSNPPQRPSFLSFLELQKY